MMLDMQALQKLTGAHRAGIPQAGALREDVTRARAARGLSAPVQGHLRQAAGSLLQGFRHLPSDRGLLLEGAQAGCCVGESPQ